MSRGPGWVQMACLWVIRNYEDDGESPTTFDIAAAVYQIKPDADGNYEFTDAQYIAVKRALAGLQRRGRVIGFRMSPFERHFTWMSEKRAQQWVRAKKPFDRGVRAKMRAIGMKVGGREQPDNVTGAVTKSSGR